MDAREVELQAKKLLMHLGEFQGLLDRGSLIAASYGLDSRHPMAPDIERLNRRSLELLRRMGLVHAYPELDGFEVSEKGRQILFTRWPDRNSYAWIDEWLETEQVLETLGEQRPSSEHIISRLSVRDWRQFSAVDIIFHPRLTILTGANGAGKTTLLNILGPHFNWSAQLLTRKPQEISDFSSIEVGEISYSSGATAPILENPSTGVSNAPLTISGLQSVAGIFISSHRSISTYQPLASLPPRFSEWQSLQQQFAAEIQIRYSGGSSQYSPLHRMKEALVSAAMHAYGNIAVRPNNSAREVWEGYQEVLKRILPSSLEFEKLSVYDAEVLIITKSAEFPLEAVSGGISAMLELSWQIFLRQRNQPSFTVCIDEPENHLHPELQRAIIPSLLEGFPEVTFIVATHSPFVVTSVQEAFVYALGADEDGRVRSRRITDLNPSATPDETLMSVLGLDTALPLWVESELSKLMEALPTSPSAKELRTLRTQLHNIGLGRQFPAAVNSLENLS